MPAQAASAATGIPARFIIGQAALESGWGKREIKKADGSSSHNVFGIKATKDWTGKTVSTLTTEYVNGKPQKVVEKFRAYDSYRGSLTDYASMLKSNPRYAQVSSPSHDAEGFAHGMQRAGYATDPHYAKKLMSSCDRLSERAMNAGRVDADWPREAGFAGARRTRDVQATNTRRKNGGRFKDALSASYREL